jgi:hypothetical protein
MFRQLSIARPLLGALAAMFVLFGAVSVARGAVMVECELAGTGGDDLSRGFYVDDYAGATLSSVRLVHKASVAGPRILRLSARAGGYNGPVLGHSYVNRTIGTDPTVTNFRFDDVPVTPGTRIAFIQIVVIGDEDVSYDVGTEPCDDVTQTDGITGAIDVFRRGSVGVLIDGSPPDPVSTTLVACPFTPNAGGDDLDRGFVIDDYPGVTLNQVFVRYRGSGPTAIQLEAHLGSFEGPLLNAPSALVNIPAGGAWFPFLYFHAPVPAGSRIAFIQRQLSGSTASMQTGYAPLGDESDVSTCPRVTETNGTAPPLDDHRRGSVAVRATGFVASAEPVPAVEYFHAGMGHYFMTAQADEIAGLDGGAYGGAFARTGREFDVFDGPVGGAIPVCRFFTVAYAPKGSHFYTADADECEFVKANPNWQYEKIAFYVRRYDGGCPTGFVQVYRIFNNGMTGAPNHRYTTDLALYGTFVNTLGWAAEGVKFCALP